MSGDIKEKYRRAAKRAEWRRMVYDAFGLDDWLPAATVAQRLGWGSACGTAGRLAALGCERKLSDVHEPHRPSRRVTLFKCPAP